MRLLLERGHVYQATDLAGLDAAAAERPLTAYIGFDATAPSLHVGSLVQIMTLRRLQQTGHRPIVLMGGGTTKVGDPSDKSAQRPMLSDAEIAANIAGIRSAFEPFLAFGDGPTDAMMVNNADWLEQPRLHRVPARLRRALHHQQDADAGVRPQPASTAELPLTFLEFNYMLMQAADFLELNRRHGCTLQFGGSEQWGNIVNGIDLIRRVDGARAFGVTAPLITTASGAKMGKTADGAVWLNAELRSPYDYWQFWRNTEDADVGRFLRLFTDLPLDEIARLEALRRRGDQRGQEGAGQRSDHPAARRRRGGGGGGGGARGVRGRAALRRPADDRGQPRGARRRRAAGDACRRSRPGRARARRRGGWRRAAACASTT